ncbi:hypothetical protein DFH28DRAFT_1179180 [Melampsora americana]|nr:hypothetical protein DFH28DRAFT_1179180 [Melampsora americana]
MPSSSIMQNDLNPPEGNFYHDSDLTDLSDSEQPASQKASVDRQQSQVADYLNGIFQTADVIPVDFDLAVAYFLQQTDHLKLGNIPASVEKIAADYSILEPLTGRQGALKYCTHYIQTILSDYAAKPDGPCPFALRYPSLERLNLLAIERTKNPQIVGQDKAVVFVDVAKRVVAVGIPPKISSDAATTLSGTERGLLALAGAAIVNKNHVCPGPTSVDPSIQPAHISSPSPHFSCPFPVSDTASSRLSGAKSIYNKLPGVTIGTLSSQVVGYGRYSDLSAGMSDTQMRLGQARQGHPDSAAEWESMDCSQSLQVLMESGTPGVSKSLKGLVNPLGIGRQVMFNMQVDHHRDGHNATLFASANFFGKHYSGGELILNYLGYAICGAPGHSVHGAFDILMHGVSTITPVSNDKDEPMQRICMAIYSHADVFAGAARFSGLKQTPKVFSDRRLWIPFYPAEFCLQSICDIFKAEKKRLYAKYQHERRSLKRARLATLEGALAKAGSCQMTS